MHRLTSYGAYILALSASSQTCLACKAGQSGSQSCEISSLRLVIRFLRLKISRSKDRSRYISFLWSIEGMSLKIRCEPAQSDILKVQRPEGGQILLVDTAVYTK